MSPGGGAALRPYLTTATLARSATESAGPALLVAAIAVLGDATKASYVVASLTASAAIGGPVVGALLDRTARPRRGFATAMAVMAAGLAAIALLIGTVPMVVTMALAATAGVGYPAITGAWSAQLPRLVTPGGLRRAYSADAATYSVAAVVAPPVAAALVVLNPSAPLWLPVLLLAVSVFLLRTVSLTATPDPEARRPLTEDLRAGAGAITGISALRRTTIITTVGFAGQASIFVAAPILALSTTGSLAFTGVILGSFAVGGVCTAAWFTRHPVARPDRAVIAATAVSALMLAAVGLAPTTWLLLLAAFAMGASEPPLISAMFQIRARETPTRLQSQVFTTAASARTTAFALATVASGWLLGIGIGAVIAFGVLLHILSLVLGLALGPPIPRREHWLTRG